MLCLLAGASGCDTVRQLFWNTLLDPSQPIYADPHSAITGIRETIGLYDQPVGNLPKDAADPLPEDRQVLHEDYRLASGDRVSIQIYELLAVNVETILPRRVSGSGFVSLPRVPPVFLAGRTEREAELAIGRAYQDAGVLTEPDVAVTAQTRVNRTFSVLGPFNSPGTFNIPVTGFRLLDALAMVGGLSNQSAEWLHLIRTEGIEPVRPPSRPTDGAAPDGGGEPAVLPLPLPGGTNGTPGAAPESSVPPLPLPGGPGNGASTAGPAEAGPAIGRDLETWSPQDLAVPSPNIPPDGQPLVGRGGPAPAGRTNGAAASAPAESGPGHWMIVDGKWTFVREPPKPGREEEAPAGPRTRIIRIALGPLRNGDPRYNIVMRDRDVVVAPQPVMGEFYIMGNISRPGVYSLTDRRITLTQAIAAAGGFGPLAVPSRVQLIRRIGPDREQTLLVDVGKIIAGKAEDYLVKPYDIINVGTSAYAPFLAVLRNAFRATYGVGFVYDRNFADIDSYSSRPNPHGS